MGRLGQAGPGAGTVLGMLCWKRIWSRHGIKRKLRSNSGSNWESRFWSLAAPVVSALILTASPEGLGRHRVELSGGRGDERSIGLFLPSSGD